MVKLDKAVEKIFIFQECRIRDGMSELREFFRDVLASDDLIKITVRIYEKDQD